MVESCERQEAGAGSRRQGEVQGIRGKGQEASTVPADVCDARFDVAADDCGGEGVAGGRKSRQYVGKF